MQAGGGRGPRPPRDEEIRLLRKCLPSAWLLRGRPYVFQQTQELGINGNRAGANNPLKVTRPKVSKAAGAPNPCFRAPTATDSPCPSPPPREVPARGTQSEGPLRSQPEGVGVGGHLRVCSAGTLRPAPQAVERMKQNEGCRGSSTVNRPGEPSAFPSASLCHFTSPFTAPQPRSSLK